MDGSTLSYSPGQQAALDACGAWLKAPDGKQVFRLFGYAGTGKTTLARHLAEGIDGDVVYAAFTGKAALMMRRNGCVGACTIHSLIYTPKEKKNGEVEFVLNPESAAAGAALIVIDECSMVDEGLALDLMSFGKPILVLGDPAQLPPVSSAGYFTEATPDAMLTEIHRQAEGNPIIRLATLVRQGGDWTDLDLPPGEDRLEILRRGTLSADDLLKADQVIVGTHATRIAFNKRLRTARGCASPLPEDGDRLICLRNDKGHGLFNGGIHHVHSLSARQNRKDQECIRMRVTSEDFPDRDAIKVKVRRELFLGTEDQLDWKDLRGTQQFTYGYAMTCHKAQGSQWGHVVAYDESGVFRESAARWLYTAITRAQEKLTLVV